MSRVQVPDRAYYVVSNNLFDVRIEDSLHDDVTPPTASGEVAGLGKAANQADLAAHEADHGLAAPAPGASASAVIPHGKPTPGTWTAPASPKRAVAALVMLALCAFVIVTNEIAPQGLIRLMAADLGTSESAMGLATTVFAVTIMIATLPLALLTTKLPRRPVVVVVMLWWSAGTLVVATADTFTQLLVGRVLSGMGQALFWAVAAPAVASMFAPHLRGRSVTRLMLGASAAGVIGLPMSTWLGQNTDWQVPFAIVALGGLVLAVGLAFIMPTLRPSERPTTRGDVPSLRHFIRVLVVVFLATASMAVTWTYITPFFVEVAGFDEETVPLLLALGGAVGVVAMWLAGRYLDRWPVKSVVVGLAGMLIAWALLALLGSFKVAIIGAVVMQGTSWSLLVAAMLNWALRHTPWSSDIGAGAQASSFNAGMAGGSILGAGMLAWWGAQSLPFASAGLVVIAGALVLIGAPVATKALAQRTRRR